MTLDVARDDGCTGSARRRRERRIRSWWRHEQQSIRVAMATVMHHSFGPMHTESGAPRGQMIATMAWEEERNEMDGAMGQKTPLSSAFFRIYDDEDAEQGVRPPCLGKPRGTQHASRIGPLASRLRCSCLWRRTLLWSALLSSASLGRRRRGRSLKLRRRKVKLAAISSSSSSALGRAGGPVPDALAQRHVPTVQEVYFGGLSTESLQNWQPWRATWRVWVMLSRRRWRRLGRGGGIWFSWVGVCLGVGQG